MDKNNSYLDKIRIEKQTVVNDLISKLRTTTDNKYRVKVAMLLVDNFKDDRIIPTLMELIKRDDLKNYNAAFIFACNEYSTNECKPHIEMLVDIVINGDYEAAMTSAQLISEFCEPFPWEDDLLDSIKLNLTMALQTENKNEEFISALISLFE